MGITCSRNNGGSQDLDASEYDEVIQQNLTESTQETLEQIVDLLRQLVDDKQQGHSKRRKKRRLSGKSEYKKDSSR